MNTEEDAPVRCQVKLEPRNTKAAVKLTEQGFNYTILKISKNSRVKRLQGVEGPHAKVVSQSSRNCQRWIGLKYDPDYIVMESGF